MVARLLSWNWSLSLKQHFLGTVYTKFASVSKADVGDDEQSLIVWRC
jgi:hypothetical protein